MSRQLKTTMFSLLVILSLWVPSALAKPTPDNLPDVAERAVQSVVNISSTKRMVSGRGPMADPFFRRFFGPGTSPRAQRGNSLGSGVIITPDGLVLTNSHVVHETTDIKVTLANGRELSAEIVGTDPKSDVAVIRLKGSLDGVRPMPVGDSKALRLGETVLAIGNPFGLGHTVTMGIVSAKGRANMGITDYEDFIQTDAAINPGNSGGALVNMKGELVGINTAIVSRSGGYQGIGFAIPTEMAVGIKNSLVKSGRVQRGWLGVSIQPLKPGLAGRFGADSSTRGVLISGVIERTPADRAGLQAGDIVTKIDGRATPSPASLRNKIAMKGEGSSVELEFIRNGDRRRITVVLGELRDNARRGARSRPSGAGGSLRGLEIRTLDRRMRNELDLKGKVVGVVVTGVDPGSPAARADVRRGDVIVAVNRSKVKSVGDFRRQLGKAGEDVLLRIRRGQASVYVVLGKKSR